MTDFFVENSLSPYARMCGRLAGFQVYHNDKPIDKAVFYHQVKDRGAVECAELLLKNELLNYKIVKK